MKNNLSGFYSTFQNNALRFGYQFNFQITDAFIGNLGTDSNDNKDDFQFYATGTTLPGLTLGTAEIHYQGLTFNVPNNITKMGGEWSIDLRCDSAMEIRHKCERWLAQSADLKLGGGGDKRIPKAKAHIDLLDPNLEKVVAKYVLEGVYPTDIGEITLEANSTEVSTFKLGLSFQYWYMADQKKAKFGHEVNKMMGDPIQKGVADSAGGGASSILNGGGKALV